jgi:hypothetical protein
MIDIESPSISVHLVILQGIIQRMAFNSLACKTWCVILFSVVFITFGGRVKPDYFWVATTIPVVIFAALDAYYLALEKACRNSYNDFVSKLHNNSLTESDLYFVTPKGNISSLQWKALKSFSVWGFYLALEALSVFVKMIFS